MVAERQRGLDYGIDHVLWTKIIGMIFIGLNIGGGTRTFAARMRERKCDCHHKFHESRWSFQQLHRTTRLPYGCQLSQRLPFFENTLDVMHSMHILSNQIPIPMLEFKLYDIYRVLRTGGVFWHDRSFVWDTDEYGLHFNVGSYLFQETKVECRYEAWSWNWQQLRYFSALLEKTIDVDASDA